MRISDLNMVALYCFFIWAFVAIQAFADDALIISKNKDSIVSGTVAEVGQSSVLLESDGTQIRVDMDKLDLEKSLSELIKPGMDLTVSGQFKDFGTVPNFEANALVRNGDDELTDNTSLLARERLLRDR